MRKGVITSGTECEWYLFLTLVGYIFDTSKAITMYKPHRDTHTHIYMYTHSIYYVYAHGRQTYKILYIYVCIQTYNINAYPQLTKYQYINSSVPLGRSLQHRQRRRMTQLCCYEKFIETWWFQQKMAWEFITSIFGDMFNHPFILFPCVFVVVRGDHEKHREGWHREKKGS